MSRLSVIGKRLLSKTPKSIFEPVKPITIFNTPLLRNNNSLVSSFRSLSFVTSPVWKCNQWENKIASSRLCQNCSIHTDGDKEMTEFLTDEIAMESESRKANPLKSIKGFEAKNDGSDVTFTKSKSGEIITIKFNVNGSVVDSSEFDMNDNPNEEQPSKMVSKPPFTIEINKGRDLTLVLNCIFPEEHFDDGQNAEQPDVIEIDEVTILKLGEEFDEKTYAMTGATMDGNLYDLLLNMLEERGINEDLINELVEYSTSYEHKCYVDLLKQMKEFVSC